PEEHRPAEHGHDGHGRSDPAKPPHARRRLVVDPVFLERRFGGHGFGRNLGFFRNGLGVAVRRIRANGHEVLPAYHDRETTTGATMITPGLTLIHYTGPDGARTSRFRCNACRRGGGRSGPAR